ncbi:MAG: hypothetical protein J5I92_06990 [Thiogranum sp.]|nr:hypothetical protein [Thiogranum sp.]
MQLKNLMLVMAMATPLFLAGCERNEGPAERAGENVDEAMEKAGETMDDAVEQAGEAVEEAGDRIRDETNR